MTADLVEDLAHTVSEAGLTVAVAESLTSGALSSELGRGEGAGSWFAGGVVAYQLSSKARALGVDPDVDPCSADCARQMADGARRLLGADVAVSLTGVGGPDPQDGHPPGIVYLGVSTAAGTAAQLYEFEGDPADVIARSVETALRVLAAEARATFA